MRFFSFITLIFFLTTTTDAYAYTSMKRAKIGRCKADIAAVRSAIQLHWMENKTLPTDWQSLAPKYIDTIIFSNSGEQISFSIISDSVYIINCTPRNQNCTVVYESSTGELVERGDCKPDDTSSWRSGWASLIITILIFISVIYLVVKICKRDISVQLKIVSIFGVLFLAFILFIFVVALLVPILS